MDQNSSEHLSEAILCRMTKSRLSQDISDINSLKNHLIKDLTVEDDELTNVLTMAQEKRIISIQNDAAPFVKITNEKATGVQRLMRKFCKRYYGEISPLIDKKTIQAVLKRHGANFDLSDQEVISELKALEVEGLIRLMNKEEAFLKLLGAE